MSDAESNDPIWKILAQAKKVTPSPFFARNVVREVRRLEGDRLGLWSRVTTLFSGSRAIFAASACAIVAVAVVIFSPSSEVIGPNFALSAIEDHPETFDPASEIATVEYLGQLMAVADPGQLDDAALADLFF